MAESQQETEEQQRTEDLQEFTSLLNKSLDKLERIATIRTRGKQLRTASQSETGRE